MLKFFENPQISFRKIRKFFDVVLHSSLTFYIAILRLRSPHSPLNGDGGWPMYQFNERQKTKKNEFPSTFFYSKLAAYDENLAMLLTTHITEPIQHIVEAWSWLFFSWGFFMGSWFMAIYLQLPFFCYYIYSVRIYTEHVSIYVQIWQINKKKK